MPIMNSTPGWANALTGLITAYGLQQAGKQNRAALDRQHQIDAQSAAIANAQLQSYNLQNQQTQQQIQQGESNKKLESGLSLPKGWSKMSPDQQIAYLNVRYNSAENAGDAQLAQQTMAQITGLGQTADRLANAQYTQEGRLPLAQAQTQNVRGLFQQQLKLLDERGRQELQAAYVRHMRSGGSASDPNKAMIAAMNDMERTAYGAQIRGEWDAYNQEQSDFRTGNADTQPAPPNTTTIPITIFTQGPNGQPVPHVLNPQPKKKSAPQAKAPPEQQGGGFNWGGIVQGLEHLFSGGGSPNVGAPAGTDKRNGKPVYHAKSGSGYVYGDGSPAQ